jgi:outer membrane protein OmpA-like peptidoglycan-associated protein
MRSVAFRASRVLLALSTALALASCKEDLTDEKATWDKAQKDFSARLDAMKKQQGELAAKVKAVAVPQEEAAAQAAKSAAEAAAKATGDALAALEKGLASAKSSVDQAMSQGKKQAATAAIDGAKKVMSPLLDAGTAALTAGNKALAELEAQVAAATAAKQKAAQEAAALKALEAQAKKKGGTVELPGLSFKAGTADLEKDSEGAQKELPRAKAFLGACAGLKAELHATAVGDPKKLKAVAQKRTESVKAWLAANGVNAKAITKVTSDTSKAGTEKVALTVLAPCK